MQKERVKTESASAEGPMGSKREAPILKRGFLERENFPQELLVTVHQLVEVFTNLLEYKDPYTRNHSEIVAVISYMLAKDFGFSELEAELIHIAGHLHDIGKIFVPDSILQKRGALSEREFELVKKHPVIGAKLIKEVRIFQGKGGVTEMVLYHHERWDGRGYPFGLKGEEIPLGARIISVADAFSAMIQERPYRKPLPLEEAYEEIVRGAGSQFDPLIVELFCNSFEKIALWLMPIVGSECQSHSEMADVLLTDGHFKETPIDERLQRIAGDNIHPDLDIDKKFYKIESEFQK